MCWLLQSPPSLLICHNLGIDPVLQDTHTHTHYVKPHQHHIVDTGIPLYLIILPWLFTFQEWLLLFPSFHGSSRPGGYPGCRPPWWRMGKESMENPCFSRVHRQVWETSRRIRMRPKSSGCRWGSQKKTGGIVGKLWWNSWWRLDLWWLMSYKCGWLGGFPSGGRILGFQTFWVY